MKFSDTLIPTRKTALADTDTTNARLLTQGGFVDQLMAGVYSYLPLGRIVLKKIEGVIREEMNALGSQEIIMPTLHPKANWVATGGWDGIDVLFKIKSRTGNEYALGQSEEEVVAPLILSRVLSYRDLPQSVYQIGWKYRDELRAKSGIMRGREFYMKDMYSFHANQDDFDAYYELAKKAYIKVFERLGLTAKVTEASGGGFSEKISYEFEVLTDAGEDVIFYCENCDFCVEDEIAKVKPGDTCPKCGKAKLKEAKSAEVGNVFDLGQKYGKAFDLAFVDEHDQKQYAIMGCFGIGVSRVMGVIVEAHSDDKGIIWPASVAPADYHLIVLGDAAEVRQAADKLYDDLEKSGKSVLYDDRDERAGTKFADADLIGIPTRLTVSQKTLAEQSVEVKQRVEADSKLVKLSDITK